MRQFVYGLLLSFPLLASAIATELSFAETQFAFQETLVTNEATQQTAAWFEANRDRPTKLRAFLQQMPKGADIHSHLSGAVYAESYIEWAAEDGYCVDAIAIEFLLPEQCNQTNAIPAAELLIRRVDLYNHLINKLSTRNLAFAGQSGHDQFFQTFGKFGLVSGSPTRKGDMLADVTTRAAAQNIDYLELMFTIKGSAVRALGRQIDWDRDDFAGARAQLLNQGLLDLVKQGQQDLDNLCLFELDFVS